MRILAISCANGLGHLRRLVGIVAGFCELTSGTSVEILCRRWQIDRLRDWPILMALLDRGAKTTFGIVGPGVEWRLDPSEYDDANLLAWEERLARHDGLRQADLVVSDNLAAVLDHRPDAVLAGSFLWSEVLGTAYAGHPPIDRFVERERELLAAHRPPMLCVEALAMPAVLAATRAIPLPWMCESTAATFTRSPDDAPPGPRTRIALVTGASAVSARHTAEVAAELARRGERRSWTVASGPPSAGAGPVPPNLVPFEHHPSDYASADLALCRPGAGALTQCVAHQVPILCLREPGSPEMAHNARRVEALGLGADLGEDPPMTTLVHAIEEALDPAVREQRLRRIAEQPRDGLARAASWLVTRSGAPRRAGGSHG